MRNLKILLLAALLLPAVSQAKTLEDLLVEKGVITKGEANAAVASSAAKTYWNGGTRVEFPDNGFSTQINTLFQTRYTFTDNDSAANTSAFDVKTARMAISGNAMHNEFSYKIEGDFVGTSEDGVKKAFLRDAYLGWKACDWLDLKMGQFKTPLARQYVNGEAFLQFPDRSLATNYFNTGYSQGLMGSMDALQDGTLLFGAGIFNGESVGEGMNRSGVDTKHIGALTARWNPLGKMDAYKEGDIDWTEELAASFGAVYEYSDANVAVGDMAEEAKTHRVGVDATMKVKGMSLAGEFFWKSFEPESYDDAVTPMGFYVQGGYFFEPKTMELAARYSMLDCDDGLAGGTCSGNEKVNGVDVSFNYYWWKHNLKAALGYALMNEKALGDGDDTNTSRWMFQLSSYF